MELELDFDSIMSPYAAILSVLSDKTEEPLINKQIFFSDNMLRNLRDTEKQRVSYLVRTYNT